MSILNGNKNSSVPQPADEKPAQHSELYEAIKEIKQDRHAAENWINLSGVLKQYTDNGTWVPMPFIQDPKGCRLQIVTDRGKAYAAMYSESSEIRDKSSIMVTSINKILDPVFANRGLGGIVIDPDTTQLYLDKGFLLKCILHGYLPHQTYDTSPDKDWGYGIPDYKETDVMSSGELLNFAMNVILNNDRNLSSYKLVSACDNTDAIPNLILEDHGRYIFVVVKGYCAEETPVLTEQEKLTLQELGSRFYAKTYYAPVGFRSGTDLLRFNACLALKGDGFYTKYSGLEEV